MSLRLLLASLVYDEQAVVLYFSVCVVCALSDFKMFFLLLVCVCCAMSGCVLC